MSRSGGAPNRAAISVRALMLAGCAVAAVACAGSDISIFGNQDIALISNQERTAFFGRVTGGSKSGFIRGRTDPKAPPNASGLTPLGVGKYVKIQLQSKGEYEIFAQAPDYARMTLPIFPPFPSSLRFTFVKSESTALGAFGVGYRRRVAVVIGIGHYRDPGWLPLEGAEGDARRVAEKLRGLGFTVTELYGEAATRESILRATGDGLQGATEAFAVIYFAGHGSTQQLPNGLKQGFIIPVDASQHAVFSTAISMDQLRDVRKRLAAKHVLYIMDSCYSGVDPARGAPDLDPKALQSQGKSKYFEIATSRRAIQMLTAGGADQQALESRDQGLFTRQLLRALDGEADKNGDGFISATELANFVGPEVVLESGGKQTPQYSLLEGDGDAMIGSESGPPTTARGVEDVPKDDGADTDRTDSKSGTPGRIGDKPADVDRPGRKAGMPGYRDATPSSD